MLSVLSNFAHCSSSLQLSKREELIDKLNADSSALKEIEKEKQKEVIIFIFELHVLVIIDPVLKWPLYKFPIFFFKTKFWGYNGGILIT